MILAPGARGRGVRAAADDTGSAGSASVAGVFQKVRSDAQAQCLRALTPLTPPNPSLAQARRRSGGSSGRASGRVWRSSERALGGSLYIFFSPTDAATEDCTHSAQVPQESLATFKRSPLKIPGVPYIHLGILTCTKGRSVVVTVKRQRYPQDSKGSTACQTQPFRQRKWRLLGKDLANNLP